MKKTKLFFALAIVIAALTFSFKVKAQGNGTVPILLNYTNYYSYNNTLFDIYFQNNTTNEWYNLWTDPDDKDAYGAFRCGWIPPGNYSIHIRMINFARSDGRYNWNAKGQSGTNVLLNVVDFTQITSSIDINDDYLGNDYGLQINVEDW